MWKMLQVITKYIGIQAYFILCMTVKLSIYELHYFLSGKKAPWVFVGILNGNTCKTIVGLLHKFTSHQVSMETVGFYKTLFKLQQETLH